MNKSVQLGSKQMKKFENDMPEGFHNLIQKTEVTMREVERKVKMEDVVVDNTDVIYFRVIYLLNALQTDLIDMFEYELSPIPLSLFDENGERRLENQNVDLKNTFK